jgi:uncharacterized membrane protein
MKYDVQKVHIRGGGGIRYHAAGRVLAVRFFGILITLVISWRGATSFADGALTGALFGFLMAIGYDFAQYGTSNLWSLQATLFDPFITAVLIGSAGGVIGFILGAGKH